MTLCSYTSKKALEILITDSNSKKETPTPHISQCFVKAGSKISKSSNKPNPVASALQGASDWKLLVDFDHDQVVFPPEILSTRVIPRCWRECSVSEAIFAKYRPYEAPEKVCFSLKCGFSVEMEPLRKAFFSLQKSLPGAFCSPYKPLKGGIYKSINRCQKRFSMCKNHEWMLKEF